MSYENFKTNSFCVGYRHRSATISIEGDVVKAGQNLIIGICVQCIRRNFMIVSDNTIQPGELGRFFKN